MIACKIYIDIEGTTFSSEISHTGTYLTVMAKGDKREVGFQDGGCFFKILKTRTNQQLAIYSIPKAYPNPNPKPN